MKKLLLFFLISLCSLAHAERIYWDYIKVARVKKIAGIKIVRKKRCDKKYVMQNWDTQQGFKNWLMEQGFTGEESLDIMSGTYKGRRISYYMDFNQDSDYTGLNAHFKKVTHHTNTSKNKKCLCYRCQRGFPPRPRPLNEKHEDIVTPGRLTKSARKQ